MKKPVSAMLLWAIGATAAFPAAGAEMTETRHGVVEGRSSPTVEAGLVATFQHASDGDALDESAASFDLLAGVPLGPGILTVYVEGATSPRTGGVTALIPDANADVGTALDGDDNGRFQVSELHYDLGLATTELFVGLLDPAGFIDTSALANDEATQFLNATLVNNPTIALPDYAVGAALHREAKEGRGGFTLLLTSSHGLADNPDRSYSELFDLDAEGKGLFAAAELHWQLSDLTLRLGLWTHTADHPRLDGAPGTERSAGAYGVLDGVAGAARWNLRAGFADERVSEAAWFVGAATERPLGSVAIGIGATHTAVSTEARDANPDLRDTTQGELYARFEAWKGSQITPSLQYVRNPGFDASGTRIDEAIWIMGLRLSAAL